MHVVPLPIVDDHTLCNGGALRVAQHVILVTHPQHLIRSILGSIATARQGIQGQPGKFRLTLRRL